jgi:hypothetical protein
MGSSSSDVANQDRPRTADDSVGRFANRSGKRTRGGSGETASETRRQVAPTPTDAAIKPRVTRPAVTNRILRGVSHAYRLVASHARMPVAPAAAVVAPIMHWAHMG